MNKQVLKYYSKDIKEKFDEIIKNEKIINNIMQVFEEYKIETPCLYQVSQTENNLVLIFNKGEDINICDSIIIKFNLNSVNILEVHDSIKNYYYIYDLSLADSFINCKRKVFNNPNNNVLFAKQYYFNNQVSFKTTKNNEEYEFFNYHFTNGILDANIRLSFKEKYNYLNNYDENILINDIINLGNNIKTINELYNFIKERLNSSKFQLYIDNVNYDDKENEMVEFVKVENGYLISSRTKYEQNGIQFVARFQNNNMHIAEIKNENTKRR